MHLVLSIDISNMSSAAGTLGKWMNSYFLFLVLFDVQHSCEALDGLITSPRCLKKFFIN